MKKVVISGMIGNALEWYDYALYAQFASIIGNTFFPKDSTKDLLTFAVFALGFVVRPLGALIFSIIGDKFGRKVALSLGIFSMALPTAAIGLLPSYESIGILAPIILCIMRLLQGLALGGEFSVCIAYLVENASSGNRGLIGSASFVSMCLGMLFGSITAWIMHASIDLDVLHDWAWRVPFVLGLVIGIIGLYIRKNLRESPVYVKAKNKGEIARTSVMQSVQKHWPELLISIGIYMTVAAPFYTLTVYVESFLHNALSYTNLQATIINTIGLIVMIIIMPISASITDKIGRKPILALSSITLAISIYPIFLIFNKENFMLAICAQVTFATILGFYMGPIPTTLVEMFPTSARLTGVALSYNISAAIFGGTAPMIALLLNKVTGNKLAISIYLAILVSFTSIIIVKYFKESYDKPMDS
jgi:MHS family proline/betaine transporter-like MFS transporter